LRTVRAGKVKDNDLRRRKTRGLPIRSGSRPMSAGSSGCWRSGKIYRTFGPAGVITS